jgi:hypothetical protein
MQAGVFQFGTKSGCVERNRRKSTGLKTRHYKSEGASRVLRLRGRSGSRSSIADGVAVDDEFDAAVALAAFGGVV